MEIYSVKVPFANLSGDTIRTLLLHQAKLPVFPLFTEIIARINTLNVYEFFCVEYLPLINEISRNNDCYFSMRLFNGLCSDKINC